MYTVFKANTLAHIRRNKIINKPTFQWIFLYNGGKHISLDLRYNFLLNILF